MKIKRSIMQKAFSIKCQKATLENGDVKQIVTVYDKEQHVIEETILHHDKNGFEILIENDSEEEKIESEDSKKSYDVIINESIRKKNTTRDAALMITIKKIFNVNTATALDMLKSRTMNDNMSHDKATELCNKLNEYYSCFDFKNSALVSSAGVKPFVIVEH